MFNKAIKIRFFYLKLVFPVIWKILIPVRYYMKKFPIQKGKGLLLRYIVKPVLPGEHCKFDLILPTKNKISLKYRETLGLSSLLYGTFEKHELEFVNKFLSPGEISFDIGANVGIFSIVMAETVGKNGKVVAFEPVKDNLLRLKNNIKSNNLENVIIYETAIGDIDGKKTLSLASDLAYPSINEVQENLGTGKIVKVSIHRIDTIWNQLGKPSATLIKIDVEGYEMEVLKGASELIQACRPTMIVEANTNRHFLDIYQLLKKYGYKYIQPKGFMPHNYLFFCPSYRDNKIV